VPLTGEARPAEAVYFRDANTMFATFDLTGLQSGFAYDIRADKPGATDTLARALTPFSGGDPGILVFNLSSPRYIRPPFASASVTLTYENIGDTDIPAPLFNLVGENARMRLPDQVGWVTGAIELLGVSGGLAGVLSPGEKGSIEIIFEPIEDFAHAFSKFQAIVIPASLQTIDWDPIKDDLRPFGMPADGWEAVFANYKASIGSTVASYKNVLLENANYLSQFGPVSPDTGRLVQFELEQADEFGAISQRYINGALGRGLVAPFSAQAITDAAGNVLLIEGQSTRGFVKLPGGTYSGTGFETGTLSREASGAFVLEEADGTRIGFRASDGRLDFIEDTNGQRVTIARNASGQLQSVTDSLTGDQTLFTHNTQGRIATITDAVGRVTSYGYDGSGEHLTSITTPSGTTTLTHVTGLGAAREHAVASFTGPDGVTTSFTYDARGRLNTETLGSGADAILTTYSYDNAGKATITDAAANAVQFYRVAGGATARVIDPAGNHTSVAYDAFGRVAEVTNPNGTSTKTRFDAEGLLAGVQDPSRGQVTLDLGGDIRRLQSITDSGGDTTRFTYDEKGNLLTSVLPDGTTDRLEYDAQGRVVASTDATGERTTFTYDAKGLLTQRTFSDGTQTSYTYDSHRNLLTATDAEGTTSFTYDAADRVTGIAYPNGRSIAITYDAAGRRATVADQTGYTVRYSYDSLGRLDTVRDTGGALLVDYGYDALGRLATETRGNGTSTGYTYDAADRVTGIAHRDAANAVVAQFAYAHDAQGRVQTVTTAGGTTTYSYDLAGQLTGVALPGGRTITYAYDAEGNRTVVSDSAAGAENYATNNGDQYTAAGEETLTYDAAGRILTRTEGGVATSYTYDRDGRLVGIAKPGSVTTFDFDALGNRIATVENGVRTEFAYDPVGLGTVFGEYRSASTTHYASGFGVAARADAAGTAFYHFDGTGNTALLTGSGGASLASYEYLPFGEVAAQSGSLAQPFTFNGRLGVQDDPGDLFYMRARTYDAELGRFTSRDPIDLAGGDTNLYRFVRNDPVNFTDPSGLVPVGGIVLPAQPTGASGAAIRGGRGADYASTFDSGLIADLSSLRAGSAGRDAGGSGEIFNSSTPTPQLTASGSARASRNPAAPSSGGFFDGYPSDPNAFQKFVDPSFVGKAELLAQLAGFLSSKLPDPYAPKPQPGDTGTDSKPDRPQTEDNNGRDARDGFSKKDQDSLYDVLVKKYKREHPGASEREAADDALKTIRELPPGPGGGGGGGGGGGSGGGGGGGSAGSDSEVIRPNDPNNIIGPAGAGADPLPEDIGPGQVRFDGFVNGTGTFGYRIDFENKPSASAPAQVVTATQTLDADLDFSTFRFGSFGFGGFKVTVPDSADGSSFQTIVDARAALGVDVKVQAELNTITGLLQVTFTSLDPLTGEVPSDPFLGFLPANKTAPEGDGFITYSIRPDAGMPSGTEFTALASIIFDTEKPIATPTVTNKLDIAAPASQITTLSGNVSRPTFIVRWTAADEAGGSGLAGTSVFFTDNDGPLQAFTVSDIATAARFTGEIGHTYKFFSQAIDAAGNAEALLATPDAVVTVVEPELLAVKKKLSFKDADGDKVTVTYAGKGSANVVLLDPDGDGDGSIDQIFVAGGNAKSKLTVSVQKSGGGNGAVTIGDVNVTGSLGSFTAKNSDLTVNGFLATGSVKTIVLRDLLQLDAFLADPTIATGGAAKSKLLVTARSLGACFIIDTDQALQLKAADIDNGTITAAAISSLLVSKGGLDADITSAGAIAKVSVKGGDLTGDLSALRFGKVSISGGDLSGTLESLATAAQLKKAPALAGLTVSGGDLTGDIRVLGTAGKITVKAVKGNGGSITDANIVAAKIAALSAAGNLADSVVLAGADLGSDHALGGTGGAADAFRAGSIGKVSIGKAVTESVIGAGFSSEDSIFKNDDDAIIEAAKSTIASLTIKGSVSDDSYFAAGKFQTKPKIGGAAVSPSNNPLFLVGV